MTAPTAMASVTADIASIQARILAIRTSVDPTATTTTGAQSTSATQFATAMSTATQPAATTTTVPGTSGTAIVADASKYIGIPYVWGGESTSGMDCSGLVQKTFSDLGVSLPRTAAEQQQVGTPVASLAEAQPGDLLFFGQPAYHVAIYAGNNQLIESPEPGKTVHLTDVYQQPTSIRRVAVSAATTPSVTTTGGLSGASLTAAGLNPAVAAYAGQFAAAEQANHLPSGLLAAVAQQESGGNPNAVSPAGAEGLMQLMPSTAAGMGVNALDPAQAISAAAQILHRNLSEFNGSIPLALAAYNAGAGAVRQYGGIPPYTETQNYVRDITAMLEAGG